MSIVDASCFSKTLCPCSRLRDDSAARFAASQQAVLAVGRSEATAGAVSLSPNSIRSAQGLQRLVLPSPNGSSIAHEPAAASTVCVGAALRNASAVARWIADRREEGAAVSVIAAGERWPDGSLRPCVEDLWGAGAVLTELLRLRLRGHTRPGGRNGETMLQAV
ncbi:2-phosphosulfolactate phosphatase [Prescottella equi]